MQQKFKELKSTTEKFNFLYTYEIGSVQDIEQIYKIIATVFDDSYKVLEFALENNIGKFLPTNPTMEIDRKFFESLIQPVKQLELLGLYCRYVKLNFELQNQLNLEKSNAIFKSLGYFTERLTTEFRKEGNLIEKALFTRPKPDEQKLLQEKRSSIIDLFINLTPEYILLTPELLALIMLPFSWVTNPSEITNQQLENLADKIILYCQFPENTNNDHDWMLLLSHLFEWVYRGEGLGMKILIQKINLEILCQLIVTNGKYLLLNYFSKSEITLQIFHGLTKNYINPINLEIIRQISGLILTQVMKFQSKMHYQILCNTYERFILTKILSNIAMLPCNKEIFDLIQFYMIGFSQIFKVIPEEAIVIMVKKLTLVLKQQKYDFSRQIFEFLKQLLIVYPLLSSNNGINQILQECIRRNSQLQNLRVQLYQNQPWTFNPNSLQDNQLNFNLLQKDGDQYVGLENLTNTCYMNSFLQSLFMNQEFRQIILQLKSSMDPSIFFTHQQSLISSLQKIFMMLTYQSQGYASPYQLKHSLREPYSVGCDQQDVNEFGHHFLEDLEHLLPKKESTLIQQLFMGWQTSILECALCKFQKFGTKEKIMGLDLHFSQSQQNEVSTFQLRDLIRAYFESEQLDFKCGNCQKKSEKSCKKTKLNTLPPFLMLTIQRLNHSIIIFNQRFSYDVQSQMKIKLLNKVLMEFELNFQNIFPEMKIPNDQSFTYHLYAFIVHLVFDMDNDLSQDIISPMLVKLIKTQMHGFVQMIIIKLNVIDSVNQLNLMNN